MGSVVFIVRRLVALPGRRIDTTGADTDCVACLGSGVRYGQRGVYSPATGGFAKDAGFFWGFEKGDTLDSPVNYGKKRYIYGYGQQITKQETESIKRNWQSIGQFRKPHLCKPCTRYYNQR